jgi:hypothetical protein
MNRAVTLATVSREYREAREYSEPYGWEFTEIDPEAQLFTVHLVSTVDQAGYWLELRFDDYPEKPYLIEFFRSDLGQRGTGACYPKGKDNFFHPQFFICHPCSRKSYKELNGPHGDWEISNWRALAGGLTELKYILDAIYHRISNKAHYDGRMG